MLLPVISISQTNCKSVIVEDITPGHSTDYPGGYGGYNVLKEDIKWARLTFRFGNSRDGVSIAKWYNPTEGPWTVYAEEISIPVEIKSDCIDCTPCQKEVYGCDHCGDSKLVVDCEGNLFAFPEGCTTVMYEVFDKGEPCDICPVVSAGSSITKMVSVCQLETDFSELVDKLTGPGQTRCYEFHATPEKRKHALQTVAFAWAKLNLIQKKVDQVDCDCIAGQIKDIRAMIESVKL